MAKDYGRRQSAPRSNSTSSQVLVVILSFLIGYLTATVMDVGKVSQWLNKEVLAHDDPKPRAASAEHKAQAQLPKPKFEFYSLLTKEQKASAAASKTHQTQAAAGQPVHTGTPEATKPEDKATPAQQTAGTATVSTQQAANAAVKVTEAKPVASKPAGKETYLIQVASFKTRRDAEKVKASLILKGFEVSIAAVSQPQGAWFRVLLGPYHSRQEADKYLVSLARNEHIKGMLRKISV